MKKSGKRHFPCRLYLGALAVLVLMTGCSNQNGSKKAEDGRSYGGTIKGAAQEAVHTAFFDVTVNHAEQNEVFAFQDGLYRAESGNTYLAVELTITNTYGKDLPMSITDFVLDFEGNTSETPLTGFGRSELMEEQYLENEFTLKQGESVTGTILFNVKEMDSYTLRYQEYYEDGFHGDTMEIHFTPGTQKLPDTEEKKAAEDQNSDVGVDETGGDTPEDMDETGTDAQEGSDGTGTDAAAQEDTDATGSDAAETDDGE